LILIDPDILVSFLFVYRFSRQKVIKKRIKVKVEVEVEGCVGLKVRGGG